MNQGQSVNYSKEAILQGNRIQREGKEQVETFPQSGGTNDYRPLGDLSKSHGTRMAGDIGGFAMALLSNPQMQKNVTNWMQQFGDSNQGFQFNQARMMKAGMLQQPDDKKKQNGQEGPKS
jgi:hypothetical protein